MKKFLVCKHCGNMVDMVKDAGVPMICCGEKMSEMVANTTDAAVEKHVPVVKVEGNEVSVVVGEVIHPMSVEHQINWVCLETDKGSHIRHFTPQDAPEAKFILADEKPVAAYEFCNLHGLWKADV